MLQLNAPNLQIRGWDKPIPEVEVEGEEIPHGILLKPEHMEELALLIRKGNAVEIR